MTRRRALSLNRNLKVGKSGACVSSLTSGSGSTLAHNATDGARTTIANTAIARICGASG